MRSRIVKTPPARRPRFRRRMPRPAAPLIEILEQRLALASADGIAFSSIKNPQSSDYPPYAITLAPTSGPKPASATFSINGGPVFTRSGDAIVEVSTWSSSQPMWGLRLVDDAGMVIYPGNATWKISVGATWAGEAPVSKDLYFVTDGTASPIVFPEVEWASTPPTGVQIVQAAPYEQAASLIIDRTKTQSVTFAPVTVSWAPVTSRYEVSAANTQNDPAAWKVVHAKPSGDGSTITITIDPTNDLGQAGSVALKVTDAASSTSAPRYIGVQVTDAEGRLPVKPAHLAIGAVNQNGDNDTAFYRGTLVDDPTGIKQFDYQYIYLNGGPLRMPDGAANRASWRIFDPPYGYEGKKLVQSLREAWKGGSIPTVVYYNLMCPNESAQIASDNIRNRPFVASYFEDLKFSLDMIRRAANGSTVSLIMEPDFLAYMMQVTYSQGLQADPSTVLLGYDVVQLAKEQGLISPDSTLAGGAGSSLVDFVKVINEGVRYLSTKAGTNERANIQLGWKFNLWANQRQSAPDGQSWNQGIAKVTDYFLAHPRAGETPAQAFQRGQAFIDAIATETAAWYFKAGVTSSGMEFMALDKYGTDGGNPYNTSQTTPGFTDPAGTRWLFNADHWSNYVRYAGSIAKELRRLADVGSMPIHLWQIPVGHVNTSLATNPFEQGATFAPISNSQQSPDVGNSPTVAAYEDSAVTWVFGDTFTGRSPVDDSGRVLAVASTAEFTSSSRQTYQVLFSGGGGSGAAGEAVFDSKGVFAGIRVTQGGSGYTSAPDVEIVGVAPRSSFQALLRRPSAAYWATNVSGDPLVASSGDTITWGSHIRMLRDAGVEAILFGPGLPNATNGGGYANQLPQDDYFWAVAATSYLRKPLPLVAPFQSGTTLLEVSAKPVTRRIGTTPVAAIEVARSGTGLDLAATHPVTVVGGTARAGNDFSRRQVQAVQVRFEAGQTTALVPIPLVPTKSAQPAERLVLRVGSARPGESSSVVRIELGTTRAAAAPAAPVGLATPAGRRMFAEATSRRGALALLSQPTDTSGTDQALRAVAMVLGAAGASPSGATDGAGLAGFAPLAGTLRPNVFAGVGIPTTVGGVLDVLAVPHRVVQGSTVGLAGFRRQVARALASRDGFVIVDYDLAATGQGRGGHVAAVAAHDARTDRFLIIDPSAGVHRPVWIKARDLWNGVRAVDPRSGVSRGFVVARP